MVKFPKSGFGPAATRTSIFGSHAHGLIKATLGGSIIIAQPVHAGQVQQDTGIGGV